MQRMQRMQRKLILILMMCAAGGALPALDWPSQDALLTRSFGWNNQGRPALAAVFEAAGPVRAAGAGELLYARQNGDRASRMPAPLGDWIAVDHGDGLISIYGHLGESRAAAFSQEAIGTGEIIGMAGLSGWSRQQGFSFALYDRKERWWINPSAIIGSREDTGQPVILSVLLQDEEGRSIALDSRRALALSQGRYTVQVNAAIPQAVQAGRGAGSSAGDSGLVPYTVVVSVNGTEVGALSLETFSARDGVLMAYRNGRVPVETIYGPYPALEAADFWLNRGLADLEIIAQDRAGNERSLSYRLQVE
ncbi:MAG: M23 family metallopeptidase [Treponema sp.]|jgi:hypothetical protein|nr:M23 family metallopeptidase [Treponema sp.]